MQFILRTIIALLQEPTQTCNVMVSMGPLSLCTSVKSIVTKSETLVEEIRVKLESSSQSLILKIIDVTMTFVAKHLTCFACERVIYLFIIHPDLTGTH